MLRRGLTVFVGAILALILSLGMALLPVPYVALGPGPTVNTLGERDGKEIITITGTKTSTSKGHLNLTTVSVSPDLNLGNALVGWFDGSVAVVPRDVVYPPGESREKVNQENAQAFKQSQTSAETSALRELGYPVKVTVSTVQPDSPSTGKLAAQDILTSVDGAAVTSGQKLRELLGTKKAGQDVKIGYQRGTTKGTATVTLAPGGQDGRPLLKIETKDEQPHPFQVSFDLDKIGGPSAGLMFALAVIDKIEPEDLTGGIFIAGTGEIDDEGNVGAIGGISQKMFAARRAGATVFLVPADNCLEAKGSAPQGLELVRVQSLDGALGALTQVRAGKHPQGC
ncbi:PDZ domain-containing protein [Cryptosporangium phraense]|uniref:YlbL family protein n=1 Tax=Cryptosporangium phraense TaxID=2593070 RepID=UPI0014796A9F